MRKKNVVTQNKTIVFKTEEQERGPYFHRGGNLIRGPRAHHNFTRGALAPAEAALPTPYLSVLQNSKCKCFKNKFWLDQTLILEVL